MAIISSSDYVMVGGKVDVLVAVPLVSYVTPQWPFNPVRGATPGTNILAYQQLFKLGELEDDVEPRRRELTLRVPGDRLGGSAGDGIETQFMGYLDEIDLQMSRWDPEVLALLNNKGGLVANTPNAISLTAYGALMQRDRSFRMLLYSNRDARLHKNYPCCLVESEQSMPLGTKYSSLRLRVSAHRAPEGHWSDAAGVVGTSLSIGVVQNVDVTGTV